MKTLAWGIVVGCFLIGTSIEWASGRKKEDEHKKGEALFFLALLVPLILCTLFAP